MADKKPVNVEDVASVEDTENAPKHAKPSRTWISLNGDDEQARLRVTPRIKRNVGRAVAVGVTAVVAAPLAPLVAMGAGFQSWQDSSN